METQEQLNALKATLNQFRQSQSGKKRVTYLTAHKERIRELRSQGISLKELSNTTGISVATLMNWTNKGSANLFSHGKPGFRELTVVPTESKDIKITLPNGVQIGVPAGSDPKQLVELLTWAYSLC